MITSGPPAKVQSFYWLVEQRGGCPRAALHQHDGQRNMVIKGEGLHASLFKEVRIHTDSSSTEDV